MTENTVPFQEGLFPALPESVPGVTKEEIRQIPDLLNELKTPQSVSQLLDVKSCGVTGILTLYNQDEGVWSSALRVPCYVAREGITDHKQEGDSKTPAGIYTLGQIFGVAPDPGCTRPYLQLTDDYYWVDDINSAWYNQLVDIRITKCDWNSAEHLNEVTGPYQHVIVVDYNTDCVPGAGSAIFLHCEAAKPTAGCISAPKEAIIEILRSLRPDARIYIH